MDAKTLQRFIHNVNMDGPIRPGMDTPCWPWTAGPTIDAAGKFVADGEQQLVHRLMWAHANGTTLDFNKDRCYICKKYLFEDLLKQSQKLLVPLGSCSPVLLLLASALIRCYT